MCAAGSRGHPAPSPHAQPCRARSKCFPPELFLFPLVVLWGQGCNCFFSGALGPDTPGPQRPMSPAGKGAGVWGRWTRRGWGKGVWVRYRRRRSGSGVPEARGTRPPPAGGVSYRPWRVRQRQPSQELTHGIPGPTRSPLPAPPRGNFRGRRPLPASGSSRESTALVRRAGRCRGDPCRSAADHL